MRQTGTLRSWNDDRGFGFIAPTHGGRELFVHITAFPRDGSRPTIGEALSYESGRGKDGKPQATRVIRTAVGSAQPVRRHEASARAPRKSRIGLMLVVLIVAAFGAYAFKHYQEHSRRSQLEALPPIAADAPPAAAEPTTSFRCDGRTHCSQMTSCQEATWFINHCPGTEMDGNQDGVPCEQQWCSATR